MDENIKASLKLLKKTTFNHEDEKSNVGKYVPLSRSDFDTNIIDRWLEMSCKNAPRRRCLHMSFIYDNYFYIYGGFDIREGRMTDLRRLKIDGSQNFLWEEVETSGVIPEALSGQSGCLVGTKFFMFGGEDNREYANNNLYILDLERLKWEKRLFSETDIPGFLGHSLSYYQLDNSLVLFGGFSKGLYKNSIYVFSLEKNQWSKVECETPNPQGRINHTATLIQDDLVIYAGKNENYNFNDMWKFNLLTKKWSEVKYKNSSQDEMPEARSGQSFIYHGKTNSAYIFGGKTANLKEKNDLWKFDFNTEKFSILHDTLLEQFNNFESTQTNFTVNKPLGLKTMKSVTSISF
jgi:N-acetylneuraminic acid mutarotase